MSLSWVIGLGVLLVLLGMSNWRRAIPGVLLLTVLEGALRKWVFPQASQLLYFAKDFLLLGAYAGYFFGSGRSAESGAAPSAPVGAQPDADRATRRTRRTRLNPSSDFSMGPGSGVLLLLAMVWTFFESLNPGTGSLVAGLFGWKAYAFYIPLCFLVPSLFASAEQLERFLRYFAVLALPVSLLGIAQFYAPPDSPLNVYAAGVSTETDPTAKIAVFGEDQYVRVTGTFSYISGYGIYLVSMISLLIPLLAWSRKLAWRLLFGCTLALVVGNAMMTGSRAPVLGAGIVLGGFIVFTLAMGTVEERRRAWVHWLAGAAAIAASVFFFEKAVTALEQRAEGSWEEGQQRLSAAVLEPFDYMGAAGVLGHGNGITQPSVSALRSVLGLPPTQFEYASPTDAENSRVLMELGIPGFFIWYGLRLSVLVGLWQTRQRLRSALLRQLALGAFLVLFYLFFTTTMFAPTANLYHWFFVGFSLLLPKLDRQAAPERIRAVVRRIPIGSPTQRGKTAAGLAPG